MCKTEFFYEENLVKSHFENFEITLESHFEITSDRGLVMHIFDITMNLV